MATVPVKDYGSLNTVSDLRYVSSVEDKSHCDKQADMLRVMKERDMLYEKYCIERAERRKLQSEQERLLDRMILEREEQTVTRDVKG